MSYSALLNGDWDRHPFSDLSSAATAATHSSSSTGLASPSTIATPVTGQKHVSATKTKTALSELSPEALEAWRAYSTSRHALWRARNKHHESSAEVAQAKANQATALIRFKFFEDNVKVRNAKRRKEYHRNKSQSTEMASTAAASFQDSTVLVSKVRRGGPKGDPRKAGGVDDPDWRSQEQRVSSPSAMRSALLCRQSEVD